MVGSWIDRADVYIGYVSPCTPEVYGAYWTSQRATPSHTWQVGITDWQTAGIKVQRTSIAPSRVSRTW